MSGPSRSRFRPPAPHGRRLLPVLAAMMVGVAACGSDPTDVLPQPVEVLVAGGDSQYGTAGQLLPLPLHVVVVSRTTDLPTRNRTVEWQVVSGGATISGPSVAATDSTGSARARVRLGPTTGEVVVAAIAQGEGGSTAVFRLYVVDRPILDPLPVASIAPGATLELSGDNFSPDPEQNVVLFSGIRGRATAATDTSLTVTVPGCLPERSVEVGVQLGELASSPRTLAIGSGGEVRSMAVGDVFDATDPEGYTCVTLPGDGTAEYLAIVYSSSPLSAAAYPVTFAGLVGTPPVAAPAPTPAFRLPTVPSQLEARRAEGWWRAPFSLSLGPGDDPQALWDERLRVLEAEALQGARRLRAPARVERPPVATPPLVGERRTFQVFRGPGDFSEVSAVARVVGERAALFVDEDAPAAGYTDGDLRYFSELFDETIEPTVTGAFGEASDLDGNERVIILFTPAVNALTPRGAGGFVAGFFFGVDLLPGQNGSNVGEVFYTLVPDPAGRFSDPRDRQTLLEATPAVLAHEFQHMVHFNERVLELEAAGTEAVWLSEALAQYAEELVARVFEEAGDTESEELFRLGVRGRSRTYLERPDTVSLVVSFGQGTLPERGAGFLFATYLTDRYGEGVIGRLTRTTRTGVANVEAETGTIWASLLSDWLAALWLDGTAAASGDLQYGGLDLRGFLGGPFPLVPERLGGSDFTRSASMRSSSAKYYIVAPTAGSTSTLRVGGAVGGGSVPQAGTRMRIVRVR